MTYEVPHSKDRLVRARKPRDCTVLRCQNVIQPGEFYVDVDPPERQNGYFAQCVPCGLSNGLIVETTLPGVLDPDLARKLSTAGRKVAEWTAERDRLIKEAVAAGGSLREVGTAAGITHTAVKFIAHGRPPR